MNLKKLGSLALAGVMAFSLVGCKKQGPEGVAAKVNDVEIPMEEFYKSYAMRRDQVLMMAGGDKEALSQQGPDGQGTLDELIKKQTLQDLVDKEVVIQAAKEEGIEVPDSEVDSFIQNMKDQMGSEEVFQQALEQQDLTEDFLRQYTKEQMLLSKFTEGKMEDLKPSDEEAKSFYEKNKEDYFKAKASHILVSDVDEANKIRKEITKNGADFAKLAKEKSMDPGSAENGGELGEFINGSMVPEFERAIKTMKVGSISDPVESQHGFHIIKLEERKARPFDEVKDEIVAQLTQENFTNYIKDLKKKAKIEEYVDPKKELDLPKEYQLPEEQAPAQEPKESPVENQGSNDDQKANNNQPAEEKK